MNRHQRRQAARYERSAEGKEARMMEMKGIRMITPAEQRQITAMAQRLAMTEQAHSQLTNHMMALVRTHVKTLVALAEARGEEVPPVPPMPAPRGPDGQEIPQPDDELARVIYIDPVILQDVEGSMKQWFLDVGLDQALGLPRVALRARFAPKMLTNDGGQVVLGGGVIDEQPAPAAETTKEEPAHGDVTASGLVIARS